MFKIILTNQVVKTNPYRINLNNLLINIEKREIWNFPDKNYIDINYLIKEEKEKKINEFNHIKNDLKSDLLPNMKSLVITLSKTNNSQFFQKKPKISSQNKKNENDFSFKGGNKSFENLVNLYQSKKINSNSKDKNIMRNQNAILRCSYKTVAGEISGKKLFLNEDKNFQESKNSKEIKDIKHNHKNIENENFEYDGDKDTDTNRKKVVKKANSKEIFYNKKINEQNLNSEEYIEILEPINIKSNS